MRKLFLSIILLSFLHSNGQLIHSNNWHGGFGFSGGTLNFKQNAALGFDLPLRYSFLQFGHSSISLGTNLKIGAEDKYGVAFPIIVAFVLASGLSGSQPDLSDIDISKKVRFFSSIGFTNSSGVQQSAFFLGWMTNAGIRFGESTDLGLSLTVPLPLNQAIGPINNPLFYEFTFTFSGKR